MFIQTDTTPNHNALKFLPGMNISSSPVHYSSIDEARNNSLLALKLFEVDGVAAVFFGEDFITITKHEDLEWLVLKPEILMIIMHHLRSSEPIFIANMDSQVDYSHLSDIEKQIVEIINSRVRPAVAMDGGDIEYAGYDDGIVSLALKGACGGCPSSSITLKNGIESMLKHFIPEVKSVRAINNQD